MQAVTTIGLDIAKSAFQVHGVDAHGNVAARSLSIITRAPSAEERTANLNSLQGSFEPERPSPSLRVSAVGEAPSWPAQPAALLGNVPMSIKACDLLPASLGKGFGQRALGHLIAASGARKNRNRRNPGREIIGTATLNTKNSAGADRLR